MPQWQSQADIAGPWQWLKHGSFWRTQIAMQTGGKNATPLSKNWGPQNKIQLPLPPPKRWIALAWSMGLASSCFGSASLQRWQGTTSTTLKMIEGATTSFLQEEHRWWVVKGAEKWTRTPTAMFAGGVLVHFKVSGPNIRAYFPLTTYVPICNENCTPLYSLLVVKSVVHQILVLLIDWPVGWTHCPGCLYFIFVAAHDHATEFLEELNNQLSICQLSEFFIYMLTFGHKLNYFLNICSIQSIVPTHKFTW